MPAVGMCKKMGLAVTATIDMPFATASGDPVHVHGVCNPNAKLAPPLPNISGVAKFWAMDVAKPLLSVAKLVKKGWSVNFTPQGSCMSRDGAKLPIESCGGV